MARVATLESLFENPVISGGKRKVNITDLDSAEEKAIGRAWDNQIELLSMKIPTGVRVYIPQKNDMIRWGMVAKAAFDDQEIKYPGGPGAITVDAIIPENVRIVSNSGNTQYSGYTVNTWDLSTTSGTACYLLGNATAANSYKGDSTADSESMFVLAKNGLLEIGSTPTATAWKYASDADTQYAPWATDPLCKMPIEPGKAIYMHPTPGMIPVYNDMGCHLSFMPRVTGTATIAMVGLSFLQYSRFSALVTRT